MTENKNKKTTRATVPKYYGISYPVIRLSESYDYYSRDDFDFAMNATDSMTLDSGKKELDSRKLLEILRS